jgi:Na+-translocating ferredoxin:NAD+ oxidoreductase RnfC subunit
MAQVLINKKTLRSRRELKKNKKNSKKLYGKERAKEIKNFLGKFVQLKDVEVHTEKRLANPINITSIESFLNLLRDKKLTGMSGNGFSTAKKIETFLSSDAKRKILLVNAVECEPGLLHDEWLLQNHLSEIVEGVKKIKSILNIKDSIIATKCAIQLPNNEPGISLYKVPAKYPMGEEHLLIHQILDSDLYKKSIPADNGILVLNVQTVYQIYKILDGTYDGGKYVTLADIDHGDAVIAYVYKEDRIQDVLFKHFGNMGMAEYAGSGIMDASVVTVDAVFDNKISFAAIGTPANLSNENPCKGCGGCSKRCPAGVNVKIIVQRREKDWNADISGLGAEKCLSCGTCTYFCRAAKDVAAYVKEA